MKTQQQRGLTLAGKAILNSYLYFQIALQIYF